MASNFPNDGPGLPPIGGPGYPPPGSPPPGGPIIPAGMVERIKNILMTPKTEWPRIAAEPDTAQNVFMKWAVPLAAIGPVCSLIGQQLFGINAVFIHLKPSLTFSITNAVLSYAAALASVWILTLVLEALAPNFGGVKDRNQAMKLAAYSYTAGWVAGVLGLLIGLVPLLGLIVFAALIYGFYLFWLGMPHVMRTPRDRVGSYFAVTIIVAILAYFVLGAIVTAVTSRMMLSSMPVVTGSAHDAGGTITVPGMGSVDMDKLGEASAKMEAAAASVQQGARAGNASGNLVSGDALQAMLPPSIGGFARGNVESSSGAAAGVGASQAKATYTAGDQSFTLSIADTGAMGQLATLGGALNMATNKQTATGYEKTAMQGGNMVSEKWDNSSHSGSYSTMVGSRFMVEAEGSAPSIDPLKDAVGAVDQGALAGMAH